MEIQLRPTWFVSQTGGLRPLLEELVALLRSPVPLIAISGLAGVGKTTLAMAALDEVRNEYPNQHILKGHEVSLSIATVLDSLDPDRKDRQAPYSSPQAAVTNVLRDGRSILLLDDADLSEHLLLEVLASLTAPAKVLVTARNTARLRALGPVLTEVAHPGLTTDEMHQLLHRLADTNPILLRKCELASSGTIQEFLHQLRGWPQALILAVARLSTSATHVSDLATSGIPQDALYAGLLGDLVGEASDSIRQLVLAAASFEFLPTDEGLAYVTQLPLDRVRASLHEASVMHLLEELPNRRYQFSHPIIRTFAKTVDRNSPVTEGFAQRARQFMDSVIDLHGGAPNATWSNLNVLDRYVEQLGFMLKGASAMDSSRATWMMRKLFPFLVERGNWALVDSVCRELLAQRLRGHVRAEWLIWASWISFYLHGNKSESLRQAQEASVLAQSKILRFEAHRRAMLASEENLSLDIHFSEAIALVSRGRRGQEQLADLHNTYGRWLVGRTSAIAWQDAERHFQRAEEYCMAAQVANPRELAIARLGLAEVLHRRGSGNEAALRVEQVLALSIEIGWPRGRVEALTLRSKIKYAAGDSRGGAADLQSAGEINTHLRSLTGPA